MGLFSKLRKPNAAANATEVEAKAMLAAPLLVAFADGEVAEAVSQALINECCNMDVFARLGLPRTVEIVKQASLDLMQRGADAVLNDAVSVLSQDRREASVIFAVRIAAADGEVDSSEKTMVGGISHRMGISPGRCQELVDTAFGRRAA